MHTSVYNRNASGYRVLYVVIYVRRRYRAAGDVPLNLPEINELWVGRFGGGTAEAVPET